MVAQAEFLKMKQVFGFRYAKQLSEKMKVKGVLNSNGGEITPNYIRQVFNGRIKNVEVINVIIDEYDLQKRKMTKMSKSISKM